MDELLFSLSTQSCPSGSDIRYLTFNNVKMLLYYVISVHNMMCS